MLDEDIRAPGWRLGVMALVVFAAMGVLLNRLWNVQIVNSESAQQKLQGNTTVKARIAPARGSICDRNGIALAENKPSFGIDLYLDDLKRDYAKTHRGRYPKLILPPGKNGRERSEADIVAIVKESLAPVNQALGLNVPINERDIREHYRTDRDIPYHYITDLDFATVAQFSERNLGLTGIKISQNPERQYTYGAFASHILGYVGKPDKNTEHLSRDGTPYESIGRHGIEAMMDAQLQGEPGSVIQRVSSQGYYVGGKPLQQIDPTVGNTIYLAMDARVQYIVETAVRHSPWTRVAVVVMDPRNGDVLALASFPNYDPNKFIPKITSTDWDTLNNDPTAPLYNRALHTYPPGSTYKIMVALAGLKSGRVTATEQISAPASIYIGDHLFHDSTRQDHGSYSLRDAICYSSDTYFYQFGIKTGIENIDAMAKLVGFGHKWGLLDSDESAGIVPGPQWMKENSAWLLKTHNVDRWSNAQTANTSIGQGFVLVTPLQMATFLCSVANGGTVYQPRLYAKVEDYKGDVQAEIPAGQVYNTLGVKAADMKAVQEGMLRVVQEGTASATTPIPGYNIAGKTGTAQAYRGGKEDDKTWFYCYGPYEAPRYVVTVMVEGGDWGAAAAGPIAKEIMQRLFAMDAGSVENVAFLQPVVGNFQGVKDITVHADDHPAAPADPNAPAGTDANGDTTPPADAPTPAPAAPANSKRR